jgi:amino acid transporter
MRSPEDVPSTGLHLGLTLSVLVGVPALVFVAVGPVMSVAGPPSVLLWAVSAFVGLLMAIPFAVLVRAHPGVHGGVATASAAVLRRRSPALALLGQWSYWLGWSPALAISAALISEILIATVLPLNSAIWAWLLATGILALSAFVNHTGLRRCARLQLILALACVLPAAALLGVPFLDGSANAGRLVPFAVPGELGSWQTLAALGGGLFLAGWSTYGSEVALSCAPEYRRGASDAIRSLGFTAAVVLLVYTLVPGTLIVALGGDALNDPVGYLLSAEQKSWVYAAAALVLPLSLLLTLNTISASSSRVLSQMARNGDAWKRLGRLNAAGAPRNAMVFDVAVNSGLLAIGLALHQGRLSAVPVALLTAAGLAYFVSLIIALAATVVLLGRQVGAPTRWISYLAGGLAVLNALLIPAVVVVWGPRDLGVGALGLAVCFCLVYRRTRRARPRDQRLELATMGGTAIPEIRES